MHKLSPDYYVSTIHDIDFEVLKNRGIQVILLDVDNTIVPFKNPLPDQEILNWINMGKEEGFQFCLVSNAYPRRVEGIGLNLDIPFVFMAKKPLSSGVIKSLRIMNCHSREAVMVGDQIFTDVLAAKLAGVSTILVDPLTQSDFFMTKIYRVLEYFVKRNLIRRKME